LVGLPTLRLAKLQKPKKDVEVSSKTTKNLNQSEPFQCLDGKGCPAIRFPESVEGLFPLLKSKQKPNK
jgi:hypothetical protein